jgi:hypothetical protein
LLLLHQERSMKEKEGEREVYNCKEITKIKIVFIRKFIV